MDPNPSELIEQARGCLQAGHAEQARALLARCLRLQPTSADGWFWMSRAVEDVRQEKDCLERVLKLEPGYREAQHRMQELTQPPSAAISKEEEDFRRSFFIEEDSGAPSVESTPEPGAMAGNDSSEPPFVWAVEEPVEPETPELNELESVSPSDPMTLFEPEEDRLAGVLAGAPAVPSSSAAPESPPALFDTEQKTRQNEPDSALPAAWEPVDVQRGAPALPAKRPRAAQRQSGKKMAYRAARSAGDLKTLLVILSVIAFLVCGVAALGIYLYSAYFAPLAALPPAAPPPAVALDPALYSPTATVRAMIKLPPTWTPTTVPTGTSRPTVTPTPLPTLTPTLVPPAAAVMDVMRRIEQQVADVRGLSIQEETPRYMVSQMRIANVLEGAVLTEDRLAILKDETRIYSALGLIKPTYDLSIYAMNDLGDSLGGVYIPWEKKIYLVGAAFGGMEHFVYSHEFNHALVDQHYNIAGMGVYPKCLSNQDRCKAVSALVEGDATLLMYQWWDQYAGPTDYQDVRNYHRPLMLLPDQFPPDALVQDLSFDYNYGAVFVKHFYDLGNWARVNRLYTNPPASTEHILHPDHYAAGDMPVNVPSKPLEDILGSGWRLLKEDTLGEWTTYLILGYSADKAANVGFKSAALAAAGWGGDRYQVYYNDETGQTVTAVHWVWDSSAEAAEFSKTFHTYLDNLYRGNKLNPPGECWEANGQTACFSQSGRDATWLVAPNAGVLEMIRGLFGL